MIFLFLSKRRKNQMEYKRLSFRQKKSSSHSSQDCDSKAWESEKNSGSVHPVNVCFANTLRMFFDNLGWQVESSKEKRTMNCLFLCRCSLLAQSKVHKSKFYRDLWSWFQNEEDWTEKKANTLACLLSSWVHYLPLWMRFNGQRPKNRLKINFSSLFSLTRLCSALRKTKKKKPTN